MQVWRPCSRVRRRCPQRMIHDRQLTNPKMGRCSVNWPCSRFESAANSLTCYQEPFSRTYYSTGSFSASPRHSLAFELFWSPGSRLRSRSRLDLDVGTAQSDTISGGGFCVMSSYLVPRLVRFLCLVQAGYDLSTEAGSYAEGNRGGI